ncbi:MAG: hypothetical protein IAF02_15680 [Anaerolineae bacterium]|nr:hypothetical protein [Anaerolineae bacterium]
MNILGLTSVDLNTLLIAAIIIAGIIFALKFVFKMAAGVIKMGCLVGILIFAGIVLLLWLI